jgi:hypothetical protein
MAARYLSFLKQLAKESGWILLSWFFDHMANPPDRRRSNGEDFHDIGNLAFALFSIKLSEEFVANAGLLITRITYGTWRALPEFSGVNRIAVCGEWHAERAAFARRRHPLSPDRVTGRLRGKAARSCAPSSCSGQGRLARASYIASSSRRCRVRAASTCSSLCIGIGLLCFDHARRR